MSDSFASQLADFKRAAIENCGSVHRGVALKLFTAVIMDTPVLSGRLRGNWKASTNVPDRTGGPEDKSGRTTIGRMTATIMSSRFDAGLILTNSLPYAARIEYDGWSREKSPLGMVRRNVLRFKEILGNELDYLHHRA